MKIFYCVLFLLIISLRLEAQQVKKIDCCNDVTPKATIVINDNTGGGGTTISNTNNSTNGVFNFTLNAAARTSAGVYNSSGVLVRTLWSGVHYDAGCYNGQWDGLLDDGTLAPNGSYNIKVLSNNVTYAFEGYIGNTSVNQSIKSFGGFGPFAFAGAHGFYGQSFAEGGVQTDYFNLNDIQEQFPIDVGLSAIITGIATDGTNVYWSANNQYESPGGHFIFATKVSDNTAVTFSAGTNHVSGRGATVANSVIGYISQDNAGHQYTALAVQPNGNYLFAVRADSLYEFNKNTGAQIRIVTLNGIQRIAAGSSNELWATFANSIKKYGISTDGTLTATSINISGITPLPIAISPDNSTVSICDIGTNQVKSYSNSTGAPIWTLGQLNGYVGSPAAANDKFAFLAANFGTSYIAYLPDGSLWINSPGEYCVKHFNADRSYKERVSYVPSFRSTCIDENDPTSIFADELEFKRDYSKPLDNGSNGSWYLKNVWTPGTVLNIYGKFRQIVTLSNGHKYGFAEGGALYDLTSTGSKKVGDINGNSSLEADGSLWTRDFPDNSARITKHLLTGFDSNNLPQWDAGTIVAATPVIDPTSPFFYQQNTFGSSTNSNRFIFFNPNGNYQLNGTGQNLGIGYHLGSIKIGENSFDWQTSKSTYFDYHGDYPRNGDYDIGNNDYQLQHSENCRVLVNGSNILTQVNAEFWQANAGQSGVNIFNHFDESGLLVSNFGMTAIEAATKGLPGMTGNGFSVAWTKVNGEYRIVQCDESNHGAITCWKISNLSSIAIQSIPITISATVTKVGDQTDLMAGLPYMSRSFTGDDNWTVISNNSSSFVYTDYYQYQKDSPDIYASSNYNQLITRKLNNASMLANWTLTGLESKGLYGQPTINVNEHWSYLEVLDINNKIIARLNDGVTGANYYHGTLINNQIVNQGSITDGTYSFNRGYCSFSFFYTNGVLTFKFENFDAVTITSTWDNGAKMAAPAFLRINNGSNGGQTHVVDLAKVKFTSY